MRDAMTHARLIIVDRPFDPVLEVTAFISDWVKRHGFDPTFQFNRIIGAPDFRLVMNLLKREVILRSLEVPASTALEELTRRLADQGEVRRAARHAPELAPDGAVSMQSGLEALPLLQHQPRDKGRYLTSFIGCLQDEYGGWNLGFYRALVAGPRRLVMFMDPRTDAHRIVEAGLARAREVPITLFNGGPLACYLAAAAKLPADLDSFAVAARLQRQPLLLDTTDYPPAPLGCEIVLRGVVTAERATEAPFGEFKGYYCAPTLSPVVEIEQIETRRDPLCLGLFCGKESGLTLMSMQNEILLYGHLRRLGFAVASVSYPLAAKAEFLAVIRTPSPSAELLEAAMAFDPRCKMFVVSEVGDDDVLAEAAIFPLEGRLLPHLRRGRQEGQRIGVVCSRTTAYDWVEY